MTVDTTLTLAAITGIVVLIGWLFQDMVACGCLG